MRLLRGYSVELGEEPEVSTGADKIIARSLGPAGHVDHCPNFLRLFCHIKTHHSGFTRGRQKKRGKYPDHGRFSGPVWAQNAEYLAFSDLQIHAIEGGYFALFAIELASKSIYLYGDFRIDAIHNVP